MAIDPICGMNVNEEEAAGVSEYKGKKYYFCSTGCKKKFEKNPELIINPEKGGAPECRAVEMEEHSDTRKKNDDSNEDSKVERIDIPIVGMTCASCATTVQSGLSTLPGVDKANVNFATSKATVHFNPQNISVNDLVKTVKKTGYDVGTASVELPIQGMTCASCVTSIEKALLQKNGVIKASVNLATEKARVEYFPSETNLGEIVRVIEGTGYKVIQVPQEENLEDMEQIIREKENKKLKTKFFIGLFLGLIIFLGSMPHWFPWIPKFLNNFFVLWVVATPVQFWIGWQFYRGAWGAFRHRNANMDTLI
ncbi:MAG: copper ion binding protein, partial [Candidatus Aminicenantes bacterium]|nr:copper ion binding protein [Candidatus Aminicenantes bacterium]